MLNALSPFLTSLFSGFRSRAALQVEILALQHQIGVLRRSAKKRPKLTVADRVFWAWLSGVWADWRSALVIVKPETVIAWHRKGFRLFWTWKVRHGTTGRPTVWKAYRVARSPELDSNDEPSESAVGSAAHPRRITQTRYHYRRD